jgi:hypothetical protein
MPLRRGEHRARRRAGDERLTGSKYLWRRPEHMTEAQRTAFQALQREDLQVGRVLKERFRTFWEYRYLGAARTSYLRHHLTNASLEGVTPSSSG